jgi:hypothetical protein
LRRTHSAVGLYESSSPASFANIGRKIAGSRSFTAVFRWPLTRARQIRSQQQRAALAGAKRRGKKLGGFRAGAKLTAKARQKGANANAEAAAARSCAGDHRAAGERRYLTAGHRKRSQ